MIHQDDQDDNQDDNSDDMIFHAPVELGGGPGLQLLSQPESEVVKTPFFSPKRQRDLAPIYYLGELSL